MTKFMNPSFSVGGSPSKEYAENFEKVFPPRTSDLACTVCNGSGCELQTSVIGEMRDGQVGSIAIKREVSTDCKACDGTGRRMFQIDQKGG